MRSKIALREQVDTTKSFMRRAKMIRWRSGRGREGGEDEKAVESRGGKDQERRGRGERREEVRSKERE
eukprot:763998-Hanusia_phi.AAC.3